jgi:uncharacterized lipoprotein YddW (UPF0748 family)
MRMRRCVWLGFFGLWALGLVPAAGAGEVRGEWVVRTALLTPQGVDRAVEQAAEAGLDTLFVQVRGRGDAFYRSQLVPRSPLLSRAAPDFDPLARVLARARARGMKVHAWINVLLVAHLANDLPQGHVVREHPEWLMVPEGAARQALGASGAQRVALIRAAARSDADVEGLYLSPLVPGVTEHLETVVQELLSRYRVDGVHFDFIRYPNRAYDYSPDALRAFRARLMGSDLLAAPRREPEAWSLHLRLALTGLARRLAAAARKARPGTIISAAVVPDLTTALEQKFQDWPTWLASGVLDGVCPMSYSPEERIFERQVRDARALAGPGNHLWPGIGAYRLTTEEIAARIQAARALGADGFVLFSHESLAERDRARLRAVIEQGTSSAHAARTVGREP